MAKIRVKEQNAIIRSLRAGMTPKIGIQHIQVGRFNEIAAMHKDIKQISQGSASFRLIIGEYGAGKTFFLYLIRSMALREGLVTVHADLSPNRRLQASKGEARALYAELMHNLATRNTPDGNGLTSVVEFFVMKAEQEAKKDGTEVAFVIRKRLSSLKNLVGGNDFAKVIEAYWRGHNTDNADLKENAIRWLRAEYSTKREATKDLNVHMIINDNFFYDALKLMSLFVRQAGYKGLLVNLDEMVNLHRMSHTKARESNYEQVLRILNDCLQGTAEHIGFLLGGTEEFFSDTRTGLCSYDALQSRLAENAFAKMSGIIDYSSPVLRLANLTAEELYILLKNIRDVFARGDSKKYLVPDEALEHFLGRYHQEIGEKYFRTPRLTIRAFVDMLSVLEQSPSIAWQNLVNGMDIQKDVEIK